MGETPKTALPPQDRNGAFSALRIKFATGRTSASLGELNSPRVAPQPNL
ncbi:hypothetical protein [Moorena sp. SIO4G3]|nr:hypothetical protein [Moorena sp. SIO4G3]NEO78940.1 hypothetical protein [Moorena sp. SIO4G3]